MDVLSDRALNRATLARQVLLERSDREPLGVVKHLVGMQGQDPELPYFGLWNRIEGFRHDDLTELLHDRRVVRGTLYRGTQHVMAADDYVWVRPLLQPMLTTWQRGSFGRDTPGVEPAALAAEARALLGDGTLTRPELGRALARRWPGPAPEWLARSAQGLLPVLHPAPDGVWGRRGATPFALAEAHLGRPLVTRDVTELIPRYLAAFGPATVMDMQAWSGMKRLRPAFESARPGLRVFRGENGAELFDLPDAPRPGPDVPAPVRFLAGFDNVLFGHADRSRIVTAAQRPYLLAEAAFTVDGVVRGLWKLKGGALLVRLFVPLARSERPAVEAEARALLAFADPSGAIDIRWEPVP